MKRIPIVRRTTPGLGFALALAVAGGSLGATGVAIAQTAPQDGAQSAEPKTEPKTDLAAPPAFAAADPATKTAPKGASLKAGDLTADELAAVEAAQAHLNEIKHMEGRFIQIDAYGDLQQGQFYLRKPGRVRFDYDTPMELLVVADGTWVAVQEGGSVAQRYPLSQTPLGLVLDDDISVFEDAEVREVVATETELRLTLSDKSGEAPGTLTLIFDLPSPNLRQWIVTDAQGLQTTVALQDVRTGVKADNALFTLRSEQRPEIGGGKR